MVLTSAAVFEAHERSAAYYSFHTFDVSFSETLANFRCPRRLYLPQATGV